MAEDLIEMLSESRMLARCRVCRIVARMTPEHAEAFAEGCRHPDVTAVALYRWMSKRGYVLELTDPEQAVRRHVKARHAR